ncbi:MAG TPA: AI-2E family transporter [Bacillota bacterium]
MNRRLKIVAILTVLGISMMVGLKYLFPLLAPFLLGIFFACLIEPLVVFLETKLHLKRNLATAAVLSLVVVNLIFLTGITVTIVYQELQNLIANIPWWSRRFYHLTTRALQWLKPVFPEIDRIFTKLYFNPELISQLSGSLLSRVINFLPRLHQLFFTIFLGAASAYFFSRDKLFLSRLIYNWLPSSWQGPVERLKDKAMAELTRLIRLELSLVLITMVVTTGSLSLIGVAGAPVYGFLAGILDLIPVLGPGLIYLPVSVGCLLRGNYPAVIGVLSSYFLTLLIRQVAEFKIIGSNLNLHPLATLLVAYLGMKFFGIIGFFLGPFFIIALQGGYRLLVKTEFIADKRVGF